jgi:hypothetical protein
MCTHCVEAVAELLCSEARLEDVHHDNVTVHALQVHRHHTRSVLVDHCHQHSIMLHHSLHHLFHCQLE